MSEHGDIPHVEPESSEDMVEEDFYNESDEVHWHLNNLSPGRILENLSKVGRTSLTK